MPTTDPAPEWDWYSSRDLPVGSTEAIHHPYELSDEEAEQLAKKVEKRKRKRVPIGFQLPKKKGRR